MPGLDNMNCISRSTADKILALKPEMLKFSLRGRGLSNEQIDFAAARLKELGLASPEKMMAKPELREELNQKGLEEQAQNREYKKTTDSSRICDTDPAPVHITGKHMKRSVRNAIISAMVFILVMGSALSAWAISMNISGCENLTPSIDPVAENEGFSAVIYDNTNGLPTSEANAIAQTSEGFIWIGSYSGLVRYDGNSFERFDSTTGVANVKSLYTDSKDRLWIGTNDSGVFLMDKGELTHWDRPQGLKSSAVRGIKEDDKGNIYVATTDGIAIIDDQMELTTVDDPRVADVLMDEMRFGEDGYLYCLSNEGDLFTIKDGEVAVYLDHEDCPLKGIGCLYPDPEMSGYIYFETEQAVVYHGNLETGLKTLSRIDISPVAQVQQFEYIDGKLWLCARNGIGVIDNGKFHQLQNVPMNNSIGSIMTDYEGNLWFTSTRQGVMKIVPNHFLDLYLRYDLPKAVVNSTCMCGDLLFVATDFGLTVLGDDGVVTDVPLRSAKTAGGVSLGVTNLVDYLEGIRIRSIIRDSKDRLWISTWRKHGLLCYDHGDLTAFTTGDGMLSDRLRAVSERNDGAILVANTGGVNVIENGKVTASYSEESGILNSEILTVCSANNGDILLGSDGGGIYILTADGTKHIGMDEGLKSEAVMRLKHDTKRDIFWFVTGNSIGYLDSSYGLHTIEKFPYSNNFDLYENSRGEMWILASNGIYAVKTDELVANGEIHPVHYGMANGLSCITTANSYSELDKNGDLYIAGSSGVVRFNIEDPAENVADLKAAVPFVDADGERIYADEAGVINLPKNVRKITIYAYVFNYSLIDPQVSYKLEGFDRSETTVHRSEMVPVDYTNLPGGEYRFVMNISDSLGRGSNVVETTIIKHRAFHEQVLFYVIAGLLTVGIFLTAIRLYIRRRIRLLEAKHREEAEKEQLASELKMANQIQTSMLPHIFPPYPDRSEFDIFASMDPAKDVGGDFYDYFMIDDDHLALVIADVSGKGIPAALFMMVSKAVIKSRGQNSLSPARILEHTNYLICANNQMDMFVTVWLGILEISTGKLTTANAGHEYPALMQPGGAFELIKDGVHGFAVGGFDDEVYEDVEMQLKPGAKLFVYTDGVPEAMDAGRGRFGTDRMLEALNKDTSASPEELMKNVRESVDGFVKEAEQFDDITMLCIEYKGPKQQ